jgi:hypothetical protein
VKNPFNWSFVVSREYLVAVYIETMRPHAKNWTDFCRTFGYTEKTIQGIRKEFGIDVSIGPDAKPSPDFRWFHVPFLGADI